MALLEQLEEVLRLLVVVVLVLVLVLLVLLLVLLPFLVLLPLTARSIGPQAGARPCSAPWARRRTTCSRARRRQCAAT